MRDKNFAGFIKPVRQAFYSFEDVIKVMVTPSIPEPKNVDKPKRRSTLNYIAMIRLLALCTILIVSSKSYSQDWILVGVEKSKDSMFIRSNYVTISDDVERNNIIKIWTRSKLEILDLGQKKYKDVQLRALCYVDCEAKQLKFVSTVFYDHAGNVINTVDDRYGSYTDVVPDSMGEAILKKVCSLFNK